MRLSYLVSHVYEMIYIYIRELNAYIDDYDEIDACIFIRQNTALSSSYVHMST